MAKERIFTETPKSAIWDRIDILTTLNGAKKQLESSCQSYQTEIDENLLVNKAKGVAFCIRSARELFKQSDSKNLTPSLTSLYYGTYNLLSALLIGDVRNTLTLENIEEFSKNGGHGLKTIYNSNTENLENNEFIYCCNNGFYKELLSNLNYDVSAIAMSKNFRKTVDIPKEENHKLISLKDLLSRIPELKNIYIEIFKEQPNYLNYYSSKLYGNDKGFIKVDVSEFQNTYYLKTEDINDILNIPVEYIFEYKKDRPDSILKEQYCLDKLPNELLPDKPRYDSPIAANCTIKPILTVDEPLLLYFKLLYILSIWTRYRPNLWREVTEGKYDEFRSLFGIFADASERIIPNEFLNKFYNRNFVFASHSYWS